MTSSGKYSRLKYCFGLLSHSGSQPLESRRLLLRPFSLSDAEEMFRNWASDEKVTECLIWKSHRSIEETRFVLNRWERKYRHKNFYEWGIVLKDTGALIGSISAVRTKMPLTMEAGYCIGRQWWGQGICTEALSTVLQYLFQTVGCRKVTAMHALENPASGRVMEKCGMLLRNRDSVPIYSENGLFNCRVYEITRRRYKKLKGSAL